VQPFFFVYNTTPYRNPLILRLSNDALMSNQWLMRNAWFGLPREDTVSGWVWLSDKAMRKGGFLTCPVCQRSSDCGNQISCAEVS